MFAQDLEILFLKGHLAVVFLLGLDVMHHDTDGVLRNRERAVALLPREGGLAGFHPYGRTGLYLLHHVGDRYGPPEAD